MDVLWFLKERTKFIRYYYDTASRPFSDIIRQIEKGLSPFNDPSCDESGEPPFLEEWLQADTGNQVLGRNCISLLSSSLQLYLSTWEEELGIKWSEGEKKDAFRNGFLRGYLYCFEEVLKITRSECPADLGIIEQIVLARNRDQHPDSFTTMRVDHAYQDWEKHPNLFFVSEVEKRILNNDGSSWGALTKPTIEVSRDQLFAAISHVETLAEWLEAKIQDMRRRRRGI